MKFLECVELLSNVNETKRLANAYIEDCRRLNMEELKACLVKTQEQYLSEKNIFEQLRKLVLHSNPTIRIISPILLREYLINTDEFLSTCKDTDLAITNYEQSIIDRSNDFDYKNITKELSIFKFVLDTAWEHENVISVDEKNLIEKLRKFLNISYEDQNILEAKASRFPKIGNIVHTSIDVETTRKELQSVGLLFYVKNSDGAACDVIPEEIAKSIRKFYNIEMRKYGYSQLIKYVAKVQKKQYLLDIIEKHNAQGNTTNIEIPPSATLSNIQDVVLKNIAPTNLIGGFTVKDGFDMSALNKWCSDISIPTSGTKNELITRIIEHYDSLREISLETEDEREVYYAYYHELAFRSLKDLRKNKIIDKDLKCEHYFEKATDYLFEIKLKNKPLALAGTEHADGKLSFRDKYILWDNKSKETPVNLKDHILQFDKYIKNSDKPVAVFLVIAPEFTDNSVAECVKYSLNNETQILLITADELKTVAEMWSKKHPEESFNLGYLKQNGRFDKNLLDI